MSSSSPGRGGAGRPPIWVVVLALLVLMARLTEAAQNLRHVLADSDSDAITKTKDKIKPTTGTTTTNDLVNAQSATSKLVQDDFVEDTAEAISTPNSKNDAAKDATEKNLRHLAESSNNDQDADDEVELDFMYWVTPIASLGLTCGGSSIKSRDGEYTCIKAGEALCQDNDGGPFGRWTFGITEDNQVNLWTPKNEIAWTFCTEVSHVCIGEERDPRPDKYSNQRPYLYFYDEKTQRTVGNLTCDGTDGFNGENLDKPTILKMVDNSDVGMYANYNITVLKFKKGQTPDPGDFNELLNITVGKVGQDMVGTLTVNENRCTWADTCQPAIDENLMCQDDIDCDLGLTCDKVSGICQEAPPEILARIEQINDAFSGLPFFTFPEDVFKEILEDSPTGFVPGAVTLSGDPPLVNTPDIIDLGIVIPEFQAAVSGKIVIEGSFFVDTSINEIPSKTIIRGYSSNGLLASAAVNTLTGFFRLVISDVQFGSLPILFTISSPNHQDSISRKLGTWLPPSEGYSCPFLGLIPNEAVCPPDLSITLTWDSNFDLTLEVIGPNGDGRDFVSPDAVTKENCISQTPKLGRVNSVTLSAADEDLWDIAVGVFDLCPGYDGFTTNYELEARYGEELLWTRKGFFTKDDLFSAPPNDSRNYMIKLDGDPFCTSCDSGCNSDLCLSNMQQRELSGTNERNYDVPCTKIPKKGLRKELHSRAMEINVYGEDQTMAAQELNAAAFLMFSPLFVGVGSEYDRGYEGFQSFMEAIIQAPENSLNLACVREIIVRNFCCINMYNDFKDALVTYGKVQTALGLITNWAYFGAASVIKEIIKEATSQDALRVLKDLNGDDNRLHLDSYFELFGGDYAAALDNSMKVLLPSFFEISTIDIGQCERYDPVYQKNACDEPCNNDSECLTGKCADQNRRCEISGVTTDDCYFPSYENAQYSCGADVDGYCGNAQCIKTDGKSLEGCSCYPFDNKDHCADGLFCSTSPSGRFTGDYECVPKVDECEACTDTTECLYGKCRVGFSTDNSRVCVDNNRNRPYGCKCSAHWNCIGDTICEGLDKGNFGACGGGRQLIYEYDFNAYDDRLPTQGPQCNGAVLFDIDALYSFTLPKTNSYLTKYENKPQTNFEALVLDGKDMSNQSIYDDKDNVGKEYSLAGFSNAYVGFDGVKKSDALAVALPIRYPYVEIFVHLAMANLPKSECATDVFPYDDPAVPFYQAELHVSLVKKFKSSDSIVDWDNLTDDDIIDKCTMKGASYDVSDLLSPPFPLNWDRRSCTIKTKGIEDFEGSFIFNFDGSAPYQTFDNLKFEGKLVP